MMLNKLTQRMIGLSTITLMCFVFTAHASNLGVEGSVYPIVEPDMLHGIQETLATLEKNGTLTRTQRALSQRTLAHLIRPKSVDTVIDLPKGKPPSTRYFNPTIVVKRDIKTHTGQLIAKKGASINPLAFHRFTKTLVFLNGDNQQQIRWIQHWIKEEKDKARIKLILVNGNIKTTAKKLQQRVYFDQYGRLSQHFKIQFTPTLVYQPSYKIQGIDQLIIKEVSVG